MEKHNRNIHTITKYWPNELINNKNEKFYKNVMIENIQNSQKFNEKDYIELSEGNHILIEQYYKNLHKKTNLRKSKYKRY